MIYHRGVIYAKNDTELSWPVGSGANFDEIKQDNDVTYHIGLVYTRTKTKCLGLIWSGVVCEKNQTRKWHDWSYKWVYAKNETERSWKTDHVRFVTKTRQDNDVTEWASAVYTKNNIE